LLYGRETLSHEEVQAAWSSKELNEKFDVQASNARDVLVTRGRLSTNDNRGGIRRSKLRTKNGGNTSSIRGYHCMKE